jgi:hypothetical protein
MAIAVVNGSNLTVSDTINNVTREADYPLSQLYSKWVSQSNGERQLSIMFGQERIITLANTSGWDGFGNQLFGTTDPVIARATARSLLGIYTTSTLSNAPALRTINRNTLVANTNNLQTEFQAAYDAEVGQNAPDTIPASVVNAANALNDSSYKIYLGHTIWYYQNFTNTATSANWTAFGGNKSNFAAALLANHIFTFK